MDCVKRTKLLSLTVALLDMAMLLPIRAAEAQTYNVIHTFSGQDGANPAAGVIADSAGNLYGAAGATGTNCFGHGCGVVYQMTKVGGSWNEQVIYEFQGPNGTTPEGPAALDNNGNVFATAYTCTAGCLGTVVEVTPHNGSWVGTVLHSFTGQPDGQWPEGGLVFESGTLYGTASAAGLYGGGSVFALSGSGYADYSQIFSFPHLRVAHGENKPAFMTLVHDANGNLYGTTLGDNTYHEAASIFELSPDGHGGWTERALSRLNGTDSPAGEVVIGPDGNLYGMIYSGNPWAYGGVYQLAHNADGTWSYHVLYAFLGGNDGYYPSGTPAFDAAGNLYGTTEWGGGNALGTVFKLTRSNHGAWFETILYRFADVQKGYNPQSMQLWLDGHGNIYGTTTKGGPSDDGVVFEITQ